MKKIIFGFLLLTTALNVTSQIQSKYYFGRSNYFNVIPGNGMLQVYSLRDATATKMVVTDASGNFMLVNRPSSAGTYILPPATTSSLGGVIADGTTVFINSGVLSVAPAVGGEPLITPGTVNQYYRGDKTMQTLNTAIIPENSNLYFTNARVQAFSDARYSLTTHNHIIDALSNVSTSSKLSNQVLAWNGSAWFNMSLTKALVGLSNVDNTSDISKPISSVAQTALNQKADITGAALIGATISTPSPGTNNNGIANTAFVHNELQIALAGLTTLLAFNTPTASYTLVIADSNKVILQNVSSANTITVPPNSSVALPIGIQIPVVQYGAGQTSFVAGAGVTLSTPDGALKLRVQYSAATLIKTGINSWILMGDIIP